MAAGRASQAFTATAKTCFHHILITPDQLDYDKQIIKKKKKR